MKILHIIFSILPGGSESMLVDIVNEQSLRGDNIELLIINSLVDKNLTDKISERVTLTKFNRQPGKSPLLLMIKLNWFIMNRNPDVIHVHSFKIPRLIKVLRDRIIFTIHSPQTPLKYAKGIKLAAISQGVYDYVVSELPNAEIRIVPNGICMDTVEQRSPGYPIHNPIRIIEVARLDSSIKGQDILIKSIAELKMRGINSTINFIGIGPDKEKLHELAIELGVSDQIAFDGLIPRQEIYSRLKNFDIMCHPSRYEGFGLTAAEGAAAGLPLVVTEGDGPWEIADRGHLCYSFPIEDHVRCADAIQQIAQNYQKSLELAGECRAFVEKHFSIANTVNCYNQYYQDFCIRNH